MPASKPRFPRLRCGCGACLSGSRPAPHGACLSAVCYAPQSCGASARVRCERRHWLLQGEVAEKDREAKSTKKLQEIAITARDEARTKAERAVREYEQAFARANPMAAVMVSRQSETLNDSGSESDALLLLHVQMAASSITHAAVCTG